MFTAALLLAMGCGAESLLRPVELADSTRSIILVYQRDGARAWAVAGTEVPWIPVDPDSIFYVLELDRELWRLGVEPGPIPLDAEGVPMPAAQRLQALTLPDGAWEVLDSTPAEISELRREPGRCAIPIAERAAPIAGEPRACPTGWQPKSTGCIPNTFEIRCPAGETYFDGATCQPVRGPCAADGWGEVPVGSTAVYVTPDGTGVGTRADPTSLAMALATSSTDVIALSGGRFAADFIEGRSVVGPCAEQTTLSVARIHDSDVHGVRFDEQTNVQRVELAEVDVNALLNFEGPGVSQLADATVITSGFGVNVSATATVAVSRVLFDTERTALSVVGTVEGASALMRSREIGISIVGVARLSNVVIEADVAVVHFGVGATLNDIGAIGETSGLLLGETATVTGAYVSGAEPIRVQSHARLERVLVVALDPVEIAGRADLRDVEIEGEPAAISDELGSVATIQRGVLRGSLDVRGAWIADDVRVMGELGVAAEGAFRGNRLDIVSVSTDGDVALTNARVFNEILQTSGRLDLDRTHIIAADVGLQTAGSFTMVDTVMGSEVRVGIEMLAAEGVVSRSAFHTAERAASGTGTLRIEDTVLGVVEPFAVEPPPRLRSNCYDAAE
ncbi:MAG: hypothetical protein RIT81_17695 [Deltaproteobacteria bacterium]